MMDSRYRFIFSEKLTADELRVFREILAFLRAKRAGARRMLVTVSLGQSDLSQLARNYGEESREFQDIMGNASILVDTPDDY